MGDDNSLAYRKALARLCRGRGLVWARLGFSLGAAAIQRRHSVTLCFWRVSPRGVSADARVAAEIQLGGCLGAPPPTPPATPTRETPARAAACDEREARTAAT